MGGQGRDSDGDVCMIQIILCSMALDLGKGEKAGKGRNPRSPPKNITRIPNHLAFFLHVRLLPLGTFFPLHDGMDVCEAWECRIGSSLEWKKWV